MGQWARREKALLPANANRPFQDALQDDRLAEFVVETPATSDPQTSCSLLLEYVVPATGSLLEYSVYVSLEAQPHTRPWHLLRNIRRTGLQQVKLEIAEVLTLRPMFWNLTQLLAIQHEELRGLLPGVTRTADEVLPDELAEIVAVPEPFRQRVRSKGYTVWVNFLGLTPLVYILGGVGLIAGGMYLALENSMPLGWAAVAAGLVGVIWGVYTGLYCLSVPENRWIDRRLGKEIGQRPDSLVDCRDPEALCVSLVPRQSFAKVALTMASDLLLLKIDDRAKRLLMEGGSDRYRIPSGAVATCEAECFFHPIDTQHQNRLWMVRLTVNAEEGRRELLLSVDQTGWSPMTNGARRRTADSVCQRINAMRGDQPL